MAEETAFENGSISNLEGLVTLTLDRVILHRPLPTCQISLKSKKLFVYGRTYVHLRPTLLGRLRRVDLQIMDRLYESWGTERLQTRGLLINCDRVGKVTLST